MRGMIFAIALAGGCLEPAEITVGPDVSGPIAEPRTCSATLALVSNPPKATELEAVLDTDGVKICLHLDGRNTVPPTLTVETGFEARTTPRFAVTLQDENYTTLSDGRTIAWEGSPTPMTATQVYWQATSAIVDTAVWVRALEDTASITIRISFF